MSHNDTGSNGRSARFDQVTQQPFACEVVGGPEAPPGRAAAALTRVEQRTITCGASP